MKKVLITAALPYANGLLHFGHIAGAYLPGDCFARFQRLIGRDVAYICGSDEHGVAITLSAEKYQRSPQEHVDEYHQRLEQAFSLMNIEFDHYSRTTWEGHVETVHAYFFQLYKNGYIEEKETLQLFSETDNRFLADRYVEGICPKCLFETARGDECPKCGASYEATDLKKPVSSITKAPLSLKPTTHWFLRFDLFKERLSKWIQSKNWKSNVMQFSQNYIDDLRPRSITRDSDWGIPVPLDHAKGKVFYVWFDAPIGYISATKQWAQKKGDPDLWKQYWCDPNTEFVQFLGKDNIPFHAIFFPAMTMGQDEPYQLVDQLPANEFYQLEGRQFSKSSGWFIDLEECVKAFSADQIRYVIAANAPENQDSEFSWKDFQTRCNKELLGKYGNLVNRVLVFTHSKYQGRVPVVEHLECVDEQFIENIKDVAKQIYQYYSTFQLRKAVHAFMELAQISNGYFDQTHPWAHIATSGRATIACCYWALHILALVSFPVIPEIAQKLWGMLGNSSPIRDCTWDAIMSTDLKNGRDLPSVEILFSKIEDDCIKQWYDKLKSSQDKNVDKQLKTCNKGFKGKKMVDFDTFQQLQICVAQVIDVTAVPKSKKLYRIIVSLGDEQRTVVSGIKQAYPDPEVLVGKKVAFLANLKPVTIMGVESQGMILAAGDSQGLEVVELKNAAVGDSIN